MLFKTGRTLTVAELLGACDFIQDGGQYGCRLGFFYQIRNYHQKAEIGHF